MRRIITNQIFAGNDEAFTYVKQTLNGTSILVNDGNTDGSKIILNTTPVSNVTEGLLTLSIDGTYTYNPSPGFVGDDKFTYEICNDETPQQCTTAVVTIHVLPVAITVPEGLSPNGDGKNDFLVIPDLDKYPNNKLTIINRWGNIVFASSNHAQRFFRRNWNWNKLPFLDLQVTYIDNHKQFTSIKPFSNNLNKKYHEGPASFNKEGTFMVFTRDNYNGESKDHHVKLQLYQSYYIHDKWTDPTPLPFNSNEYSVGHPTLTADGKTLYFASDMPGGYGGTDIYVCYRTNDGSQLTWAKI